MKPLTLSRTFPYLLIFPSTKFWSNYIAWLYIKRTKLHTKRQTDPALSDPLFWNFIHLIATYTFSYFSISLTKSLFIDNNITHILQHQYPLPIFPTLHYFEISSLCCSWTHLHLFLYFSCKISILRKQHNQCHNIKNNSSSSFYYIKPLYYFISYFHIFYKHIPHKIPIHTSHISLNSMSHKVYIYKIHVQQSIYI